MEHEVDKHAADQVAQVKKYGLSLGVSPELVGQLITIFGPVVGQLLLQWLERKSKEKLKLGFSEFFSADMLRQFAVHSLKEYRVQLGDAAEQFVLETVDKAIEMLSK